MLCPTQTRGFFMMRRLLNKNPGKRNEYTMEYDQAAYLKAMKRFQRETRGLPPDAPESIHVRN